MDVDAATIQHLYSYKTQSIQYVYTIAQYYIIPTTQQQQHHQQQLLLLLLPYTIMKLLRNAFHILYWGSLLRHCVCSCLERLLH